MESAYVYILYSGQLNRFYIGSTTVDPELRKDRHLSEYYGPTKYTSKASDWQLYFSLACKTRQQAIQIEKHIKRMKSKQYIENLTKYSDIGKKLLAKYI